MLLWWTHNSILIKKASKIKRVRNNFPKRLVSKLRAQEIAILRRREMVTAKKEREREILVQVTLKREV